MEDANVEIMGRDGQLQNPEVNMWYLFKINLFLIYMDKIHPVYIV